MAAAPQYGTMTFRGQNRSLCVDIYVSDVAAALVRYGVGGGATASSPDSFVLPEGMRLIDLVLVTGLTDTTKLQVNRNSAPTGDMLRDALQDDGVSTRPPLFIPFPANSVITMTQLA